MGMLDSLLGRRTREVSDDASVRADWGPLIMDIGMNDGLDSSFYLSKGFRVVAVEANPILIEKVGKELADYVASGQLIIEPVGLGTQDGEFTFYLNQDNDQWSSFDRVWGTRNGTRYEEIPVACVRPQIAL